MAGLIGPRHLAAPRAFAAAATFVERELAAAGYATERQTYQVGQHEVANIVAELPGDRRRTRSWSSAHITTRFATTPGADDNASAVAVLIEVARLMRPLHPATHRPLRQLRLRRAAVLPHRRHGQPGVRPPVPHAAASTFDGMLCLEMVGYYSTEPGSQQDPTGIPRSFIRFCPTAAISWRPSATCARGDCSWQFRRGFKRAVRFPLLSLALPESIEEIRLSDNSSFWDQGYPALMLTDTSFLRNPHYHRQPIRPTRSTTNAWPK